MTTHAILDQSIIEKIILFAKQFGGKEALFTLMAFTLFFFFLSSLFKRKIWRLSIAIPCALFVVSQLSSLYFTQSFIGYRFFSHFGLYEISSLIGLYIFQLLFVIFLFLCLSTLFFASPILLDKSIFKYLKRNIISKGSIFFMVTALLCTTLTLSNFLTDTNSLWISFTTKITPSNSEKFKDVLAKYHMKDYIISDAIVCASSGNKNIIIISLESLEKSFLEGKFATLTPNLQKLKSEWSYIPMEQNPGSDWTSGSLYTTLTGFPSYFGRNDNDVFQKTYSSNISSISHVLKKANHTTVFMNGDANFSGVKAMLNTFKFDKILDKYNSKTKGSLSRYGIRDKDLFDLAKKEVETLSKNNQPFTLYISTTDTHFPNGIYDHRMEKNISKKETALEFMIAAVDHMVGDFITFLEKKKLLSSSVVYILPDHLKMGDPTIFDESDQRGLYVITNADPQTMKTNLKEKLFQVDLPKLILAGAGIQHNLKFFTEYIPDPKNEYIANNIAQITEINTSGLLLYDEEPIKLKTSSNYEAHKKDNTRYIAHAGGAINGLTYTNSKEALDYSYEKGFRLFELDILTSKDGEYVAAHDWQYWSKITGYKTTAPVDKKTFLSQKIYDEYTPLDMTAINNWFLSHKDAVLVTDKINEPIKFSKKFVAPERLIMELFDMQAVKKGSTCKIKSAMPSQNVIANYKKKDVKKLKEMGVKNIAISRTFIRKNREFLDELKRNNIKVYAYGINSQDGINEEYVSKYEMDYIYGIYADEWEFD